LKIQYLGDVNDYRKFALLRALEREGRFKMGVSWMLTPDDGCADGGNRAYLNEPQKWKQFDPELFEALKRISEKQDSSGLDRFERAHLIPGATYFGAPVTDALVEREKLHNHCLSVFAGAELAFFDPDNGLEIASCPRGRKRSSKFVYYDEIESHWRTGRSALIYQHFPRESRAPFIARLQARLSDTLPDSNTWAFETAHVVFLLAAQPRHAARAQAAVIAADKAGWMPRLFQRIHRAQSQTG
jgi:hypothetical protein